MSGRINPVNLIRLLQERYSHLDLTAKSTPVTAQELELVETLTEIIQDSFGYADSKLISIDDLSYDDEEPHQPLPIDVSSRLFPTSESESSSYSPPSSNDVPREVSLEMKKKIVNYWLNSGGKLRDLDSVQRHYSVVKSRRQLYRWKKIVENNGTPLEKISAIRNNVISRFNEAKSNKLIVHDLDLRRWALAANDENPLDNFTASNSWITKFKHLYKIRSKKITKFVTAVYHKMSAEHQLKMENFVIEVHELSRNREPCTVFNTDQCGVRYEFHAGRTLEFIGERRVEAIVQSVSATTHSYTIMPILSASGHLISPLFVILQEVRGKFGPRVEVNILRPNNLDIHASSSGLMHKDHWKLFLSNNYFPNVGSETTLLYDSWSTGSNMEIIEECTPEEKSVDVRIIPPKATSKIQPLDVFFFRMFKEWHRKFSDRVLMDKLPIVLSQRNNVLILLSLWHNQFSSPRFQEFRKQCWFKCGYFAEDAPSFVHPVKFTLGPNKDRSSCTECGKGFFIRCGWCKSILCFNHFFISNHFCENYVE